MTTERRTKILAVAAGVGLHSDLYWNDAKALNAEGLIELRETFTKVGNRVRRWFLV